MSHFHRTSSLSAGEDDLPRVVVDAHWKELTVPVRCLLADLGLPVIEVAFIHPDLSAEGPGRHVALKKGLICRPECVYRFHMVLFYEPQSYSGGVMRKRVSVSGVTYCNINPESYLSNFRGQCYLFTLLFLCPLVRKEIPVGFDWSPVRHFSHPVEQVGEIFKEVDAMQPAGTCQ